MGLSWVDSHWSWHSLSSYRIHLRRSGAPQSLGSLVASDLVSEVPSLSVHQFVAVVAVDDVDGD